MKEILLELKPDIVALQETNLKEKEKITVKSYEWIGGNRNKQSGGGVGFLINEKLIKNAIRD